jgi:hypothetical protein
MPISNAEKQARFREKERFHKYVSDVSRQCQFLVGSEFYLQSAFGDIDSQIRKAADLPSGWTVADLGRAAERVRNIHGDILGAVDQLGADVQDGRDAREAFITSSNPTKWREDTEKAKRDTIALSRHLVSALELSQLPDEERAAALMEAVRHVGRSLVNSNSTGQSDAAAVCLAAVNPHYERPESFVQRFADWLRRRVDDTTRRAIAVRLMADDLGAQS